MTRLAAPPRLWFALCMALALVGCESVTPAPAHAVLGGALTVAGPPGYCVDPGATRQSRDTAIVLIGRCKDAASVAPALMTVSVGPAGSAGVLTGGAPALAAYFSSVPGRAALSRRGIAADVTIIETAIDATDAALLHLKDRAVGEYWRAVVAINTRLVTVSANGSQGAPLAPVAGRVLVDATLAALRRAN